MGRQTSNEVYEPFCIIVYRPSAILKGKRGESITTVQTKLKNKFQKKWVFLLRCFHLEELSLKTTVQKS